MDVPFYAMMDFPFYTVMKRPYVFLFLAAFLFLGIRHLGLVKTLIWLVVGYLIAFASEYSSIHNGFPYGQYHYIYENLKGEWMLAGVPVWDSISYSFMTYASYTTAVYMMPKAKAWKLWIVGAGLTTLLDIITDPVAKLGKDWFLGEIYYYVHDGWYFDIPFTNFAGWFLVALLIIGANLLIWRGIPDQVRNDSDHEAGHSCESRNPPSKVNALYPFFYISICIFNTVVAFAIGATLLASTNLIITLVLSRMILYLNKKNS